MRHATSEDLDPVEPFLEELRSVSSLTEKQRGTFYRRSRAFLHFHQDPAGLYADVRFDGDDFERIRVETVDERAALLERIRALS